MDDLQREALKLGRAPFGPRAGRLRIVRGGVVALAAILGLVASGWTSGVAQSQSSRAPVAARSGGTQRPLRAVFYDAVPVRLRGGPRPRPVAVSGRAWSVARQLAALGWARADAAIMPWSRPGSAADRALGAVLSAGASRWSYVRVAALIDRRTGTRAFQMQALAARRASARAYLHIGSRPAVFVALADGARRDCGAARRWRAAAVGFWLAQATFPGYGRCSSAADAWFPDQPSAHTAQAPGTFVIRPGFWPQGAKTPRLRRSVAAWRRSVARMNASGAPLQLIDSLNGWVRGTAIEASAAWRSRSGFGRYLDVLHARSAGHARRADPPTVGAVAESGVSARGGSVVATLSAGSAPARWWVEFGLTTAYGQTTPPLPLPAAGLPRAATADLGALAPTTTYHARVVAISSAGVVTSPDAVFTTPAEVHPVRVAAAGDVACDPVSGSFAGGAGTATECHQLSVSNAILAGGYDAVLALGDLQYNSGTASQFAGSYDPSWGRLKAITHPAVGNHEYGSPGASAYFQYFGTAAGDPSKGYYSYDLGAWHLIAINSNCSQIGGCGAGSPQEVWLRSDLAAHPVGCTLAYWHHPRFTSGDHGNDTAYSAIWSDLYAAGAEIVLNGHDHDYERFAPQTDTSVRNDATGIREFVVGTGGKNHYAFKTIQPNSEVRDATSFGFLELTLNAGSYAWRFVSDTPGGLSDNGSGSCH